MDQSIDIISEVQVFLCVNVVVYAIIALFVTASSLALQDCVSTLFHLLPVSDKYKLV